MISFSLALPSLINEYILTGHPTGGRAKNTLELQQSSGVVVALSVSCPSRSYKLSYIDLTILSTGPRSVHDSEKKLLFFVIFVFVDMFEEVVESQEKGTRHSRIDG